MAEVKLHKSGPKTLTIRGFRFVNGETRSDVPNEIARKLVDDDRFIVRLDEEAKVASLEEAPVKKGKPDERGDRVKAIKEAIDKLEIEDDNNWTNSGKPDARALSSILGWVVTTEERDEAFQALVNSRDTGRLEASQEDSGSHRIRIIKGKPSDKKDEGDGVVEDDFAEGALQV